MVKDTVAGAEEESTMVFDGVVNLINPSLIFSSSSSSSSSSSISFCRCNSFRRAVLGDKFGDEGIVDGSLCLGDPLLGNPPFCDPPFGGPSLVFFER